MSFYFLKDNRPFKSIEIYQKKVPKIKKKEKIFKPNAPLTFSLQTMIIYPIY